MTLLLTDEQERQVELLAAEGGLSPEQVAAEIFDLGLHQAAELAAELAEAREDLAAGRTVTSEQVWQRLEQALNAAA